MLTVTGIFSDAASALLAGERVREVAAPNATVRVLLPGRGDTLLQVSVLGDSTGLLQVPLLGFGVGLVGLLIFKLLGFSWGVSLIGLLVGATTGLLLAVWLTGELYHSRTLAGRDARRCHELLAESGQAAVTALVSSYEEMDHVRHTLQAAGGRVSDGGLLRQLEGFAPPRQPLPT